MCTMCIRCLKNHEQRITTFKDALKPHSSLVQEILHMYVKYQETMLNLILEKYLSSF